MEGKDRFTQYATEKPINIVAFAVFSFVPYLLFFIAVSAAQDILAGTEIPTSVVFMCDVAPYCLVALVMPVLVDKTSHLWSMLLTFGLALFGIAFLAFVDNRNAKLVGVCMLSLGSGFADVCLLSLTALYGEVTVNAYVTGTGIAAVVAGMYYAGMTTWLCVSMNTTLMIITWVPLLLPLFYCLMDKKSTNEGAVTKPTSHKDVTYSSLNSESQKDHDDKELHLTCEDKLAVMWQDMPLFLSFYMGVFGKYFVLSSVLTSLVFSNAPFQPRDHYQYYVFTISFGSLIGTSYGLVMYCSRCNVSSHTTRHTWIFASVITASMFFLVFASWFHFLHSVWFVIFVVFLVGLNEGVLYNCTFASAVCNTRSPREKRFSRAFLTASMGLGILGASFMGLYIEPLLKEHCAQISEYSTNCLTRVIEIVNHKCLFK